MSQEDAAGLAPDERAAVSGESATVTPTDEGMQLLIVGPSGGGGIDQFIGQHRQRVPADVTVHDTGAPEPGDGVVWFLTAVLRGLAAMVRFPANDRPDVVHVHCSYRFSFYRAAFYVLFTRYVWKRPVVLHVHGSSFDSFVTEASPLLAAFQHVVFDAADRVVVLSPYWKRIVGRRVDAERIAVVPNAVDPSDYPADPTEDGVARIVFVSNLIERKGVAELIEALDSLLDGGDRAVEVTIAGDGPLAPEVAALAERHDAVTYLGYVSEERKRELLAEGSIFVLPTYAEGLPIAMLEGMAGGNAVVSTDVGAIPEVIDESRGRLVPPGDVDALAAALSELLDDDESRQAMAERNRRAVETEYSWDAAIERLLSIYRSVTSGARS